MKLIEFRIENEDNFKPTISFPNPQPVSITFDCESSGIVPGETNLTITYDITGNSANILFDNGTTKLVTTKTLQSTNDDISDSINFIKGVNNSDTSKTFTVSSIANLPNSKGLPADNFDVKII